MKIFYSLLCCFSFGLISSGILNGQTLISTCPNSNFNTGSFTNWTGTYGYFATPGQYSGLDTNTNPPYPHGNFQCYLGTSKATCPPLHAILAGPGTLDPNTGDSLISVFPGEAYGARLGHNVGGSHAATLKYTVYVDNSTYLFIYRYAVVLQNPNHSPNQQPSFTVAVEDSTGTIFDSTCGYYYIASPPWPGQVPPTWHRSAGHSINWKEWTTVGMDLQNWVGHHLSIVFTIRDCSPGGHFGYAYVSAYCSYLTIQTSMCQGDSSATLTAPPGFAHYHWSNGDTLQQIIVPHPTTGETVDCILTAVNGCTDTIHETLTYTVITTNFTHGTGCSGIPTQFNDSSYVNQNSVTGWKWNFGDGTPVVTGNPNPQHIFVLPGTYNVQLISNSTEGCKDSITKWVTVDTLPVLMNSSFFEKICNGTNTNITLIPNKPAYNFTWTATANSGLVAGYSNSTVPGTQITQTLTNTDNKIDTVYYNITPHSPQCTGLVSNYKVAVTPVPILTTSPLSKSICDSLSTNITLQSNTDSTFFTWTCSASSPDVSGYSNSTVPAKQINQVLYNSGINIDTVTYHITPQSFGCIGTTTYNYKVTVYPMPDLSNSPLSKSQCNNSATNIILTSHVPTTLFTWTCIPSSGNLSGYSNNAVPTTILNQTLTNSGYTIETVTYNIVPLAYGCSGHTYHYVVTVFPVSDINYTPASPSICANQTTNIVLSSDVVNTSFTWTATCDSADVTGYGPGSGNSIAQTLGQPGYAVETVIYHVSSTANSCTGNSVDIPVLINPKPHLITTPMNQAICSQTSTNIVLISSCLNTTFTWTSSVVTGNISGNGSGTGTPITQVLTNNINTQGQVNYTVHPTAGICIGDDTTYTVFVNPKPHITTTPLTASLCSNSTTNIILLSDVAGATFTWIATGSSGNVSGYSSGSGSTIMQTLVNSGISSETVTYHIVASASGCNSDTAYFVVTVHPLPVPTIMGSVSVCLNSTTVYSTTAGMSGYIWTVSAGGTITSGGGTSIISVTWNSTGAQTISVNYTDGFGCSAATPTVFNVNVSLLPVPSLVGGTSICVGNSSTYTTDPGMSNYLWVVSAGGTITAGGGPANNTVTIHWTVTGSQTVSVNYQAGPGCSAPSPTVLNVTINPLPVPVISGTNSLCVESTGITYTTQPGMTGYIWAVSAGGAITSGGTVNDNFVTLTWNNSGAQTVSVGYTNGNGCTSSSPTVYPVTVNPLPIPNIAGPNNICSGSTGNVYTTQPGMTNYSWTISPAGTITAGGTATNNTVTVTWNAPGASTVSVNYHDANNCTALTPTVYNVNVNPLPTATISGTTAVCKNAVSPLITFTGGSSTPPYTFTYNINGGGNQIVTTVVGNSVTVAAPTNVVGTYTYNLISVQDGSSTACSQPQSGSAIVTVNPLPTATIAGTTVVCQLAVSPLITFTGASSTPPYTFTYSINGGTNQNVTTVAGNSVTVAAPTNIVGSFTYNLVSVQDGSSTLCSQLQNGSAIVTVNPLPTATIAGTTTVCKNAASPLITFTGASSTPPYTFTYNINGGANQNVTTVVGNSVTVAAPTNTVGSFTYNLISVQDGSSTACSQLQSGSAIVTVNPLPTATIAGTIAVCQLAASPLITFTGSSSTPPYTFTYNINGGGNQIVTTVVGNSVTVAAPTNIVGSFTYNLVSVQDGSSTLCSQLQAGSAVVTVNPLPTATISGTTAVCQNSASPLITFTGGSSTPPYTFTYNINGGANHVVTTVVGNSITVASPTNIVGIFNYNLVSVQDASATLCSQTQAGTATVTINPLPVPTISGPASVCLNSSASYFTAAGMSNYIWTVSAGGSITSGTGTNTITILWSTVGAKTITVNYNDANGCTAAVPTSNPVNVNTLPVPSLNGSNITCTNTSITYTTDIGMNNYSWLVSAGGSITAGGGISDSFVTVLWNTSGAQNVSVNYFMSTGCTAAAPTILNVTVKPRPSVTNASNSTQCSNGTTNIVMTASLPGTTFTWTATGSSGNVSGYSNGAGGSIIQTLVNTGFSIETVNYAVTPSLNGCDGVIANYIVTVNPVADVYFNPNGQSFCSGGTTSINILSHVAGATFTWTATGSSGNVSGFGPGSGSLIVQTLINSGPYFENVNYDVFPLANSCAGTDNHVIVNMNPTPQVSFTTCNDIITTTDAKPITLKGGIPLGGVYSGTGVNTGIFYPSLAGPGNFSINYSYTNTWGCNANMSQIISVISAIPFNCNNTLTDIRDNQQYPTVKLGTQCWMSMNLNYGNIIPSTSMQRDNCISEKYCFNDLVANCASYGGLYQWDELMQYDNTAADQGFCPPAWHIPTNNDWNTLFGFYISNGFAGSPLKYTGYSGFNAFLSGTRFNNVNWNFSDFAVMFWTSTMDGSQKAWAHGMNTFNPSVSNYPSSRTHAFNVRCIKD